MDKRVLREYRSIRSHVTGGIVGESALWALRHARARVAFADLESEGLVQLRAEPDEDFDWSDLDKDCPGSSERFGDDGAWGSIVEVRASVDDEWEQVDSCWGHVGYRDVLDPNENCYVDEHIRSAVAWHEAQVGSGAGV